MKKKGFTLIEILSVIIILGVIFLFITPKISNLIKESRNLSKEINEVTIINSVKEYASSYEKDFYSSFLNVGDKGYILVSDIISKGNISKKEIEEYGVADTDYVEVELIENDKFTYKFVSNIDEIRVKFDLNDGVMETIDIKVKYNEPYGDLPIPTKDGYAFVGWYKEKELNNKVVSSTIVKDKKTHVLYAKWVETVKLEVDLNGGSTTQDFEEKYAPNTEIKLISPTKKGYTFAGWQIVSGDSILSGNNLTIGSVNTIIKATYSPITYTINYNVVNDNSGNSYPNKGTYDSILTIKNPSRTGYTFDGWIATNIDTTTAKYGTTSPNTIWNGTTKVKDTYFINLRSSVGTVTMNANYTATSQTLTVNLNGGTTSQSFKGTYKTNEVITLTNPTRTGYTFTGWSVTSGNSILSGNKLTMGSQNTTITANWKSNKLITYIENLYNTDASENGLVKDDTEDKNIRYAGSNDVVKNYVSFDGEIWRIIGIVDGKVKLVKEESIGSYSWDSSSSNKNSGNGYNIWETKEGKTKPDGTTKADINILLNEGYYNGNYPSTCYGGSSNATKACPTTYINPTLKKMVDENAVWYLGGHSTDIVGVKEIYNYERETKIYESHKEISKIEWMGAVGLIYASDYGYAVDRTKCNGIFTDYNESICKDNNWLYKKIYYWTMLISNEDSYGAFSVTSLGAISFSGFRYFSLDVFPTIYLKENVLIKSGSGEKSNPYILIID